MEILNPKKSYLEKKVGINNKITKSLIFLCIAFLILCGVFISHPLVAFICGSVSFLLFVGIFPPLFKNASLIKGIEGERRVIRELKKIKTRVFAKRHPDG